MGLPCGKNVFLCAGALPLCVAAVRCAIIYLFHPIYLFIYLFELLI
jgi:hypothetical protein